jgi:hypothetical protein
MQARIHLEVSQHWNLKLLGARLPFENLNLDRQLPILSGFKLHTGINGMQPSDELALGTGIPTRLG